MTARGRLLHTALALLLLAGIAQAQEDMDIRLVQYGVGNTFRPGDVIGVDVELTSNLPEDENVWVQWDHETADGDIVAFGRQVTLSPGQPRRTWLYVPLGPKTELTTQGRIRVRSLQDGEPGRDLGILQFEPSITSPRRIERSMGLIGVVGKQMAGLEAYERPLEIMRTVHVAPEKTIVPILSTSAALPDRWIGLRPYEAIVWTDAAVELSPPQEAALIEWMNRGGHLVIMLPQTGNPWSLGTGEDGPLGSLMPEAALLRESVPVPELLEHLIKQTPATVSEDAIPIHVFRADDFDAAPAADGWIDLWTLEDTGTAAVQRPVGQGRLTMIGVDLSAPPLRRAALAVVPGQDATVEIVPEPDVFWNRILGRRVDTPPSRAIKDLQVNDRLTQVSPSVRHVRDAIVLSETDDAEQVGGGLLIAFILFIAYWLIAVPACWSLLKSRKKLHWSWVGFFATSLVFTAVAWITVTVTRESDVRIRHLTVLDHVHGEDRQRAVSWLSIFTPGYGDYDLRIDSDSEGLLTPWEPEEGRISGFPDTRQTSVDVGRFTNRLTIPSRATTTTLQVDWRGPITASDWGDVLRMDPERPVTVQRNSAGEAVSIRGSIMSELPGEMQDGQIVFVDRPHPRSRQLDVINGETASWVQPSESGRMERKGWAWSMGQPIPTGGRITLDNQLLADPPYGLEDAFKKIYSDSVQADIGTPLRPLSRSERRRALEALTFYHQLEPPNWIRANGQKRDRDWSVTTRSIGRELDLSPWLTRPSLIVTGFLDSSRLPIPLLVEGDQPAASTGLVLVRWILPIQEETPVPAPGDDQPTTTEG